MYCNFCGAELDQNVNKCPICGHDMLQDQRRVQEHASGQAGLTKEKIKNALHDSRVMLIVVWSVWILLHVIFAFFVRDANSVITSFVVIYIVSVVFGWKKASEVVTKVYNSVLGGLTIIAPIMTFVYIALIKVGLRLIIAPFIGWFTAPSIISKFIGKRLG